MRIIKYTVFCILIAAASIQGAANAVKEATRVLDIYAQKQSLTPQEQQTVDRLIKGLSRSGGTQKASEYEAIFAQKALTPPALPPRQPVIQTQSEPQQQQIIGQQDADQLKKLQEEIASLKVSLQTKESEFKSTEQELKKEIEEQKNLLQKKDTDVQSITSKETEEKQKAIKDATEYKGRLETVQKELEETKKSLEQEQAKKRPVTYTDADCARQLTRLRMAATMLKYVGEFSDFYSDDYVSKIIEPIFDNVEWSTERAYPQHSQHTYSTKDQIKKRMEEEVNPSEAQKNQYKNYFMLTQQDIDEIFNNKAPNGGKIATSCQKELESIKKELADAKSTLATFQNFPKPSFGSGALMGGMSKMPSFALSGDCNKKIIRLKMAGNIAHLLGDRLGVIGYQDFKDHIIQPIIEGKEWSKDQGHSSSWVGSTEKLLDVIAYQNAKILHTNQSNNFLLTKEDFNTVFPNQLDALIEKIKKEEEEEKKKKDDK